MSVLLLARHGEAHCNRLGVVGGPNGCRGLTDRGRRQVELLGQRLRARRDEQPVHALYTTPLRRAHESAAILGAYLGLDPAIEPDLAEQHHGAADGQLWTEAVAAYGGVPERDPDRPLAPGGESWRTFLHRAGAVLAAIVARHEGVRVLVVGHSDTVEATFHHFFRLAPGARATVSVNVHYAGLTVWQQLPLSGTLPRVGPRWTLTAHNDIRHLIG